MSAASRWLGTCGARTSGLVDLRACRISGLVDLERRAAGAGQPVATPGVAVTEPGRCLAVRGAHRDVGPRLHERVNGVAGDDATVPVVAAVDRLELTSQLHL